MGAILAFCFSLYDYIVLEYKKLDGRLPKWVAVRLHKWFSVSYCLLFIYIVGLGVLWGIVLLIAPNKTSDHVKLIDAMFNSFSAVTGSGLASVAMSSLSTFQLFVLMLLCLVGAKVFTTYLELTVRMLNCKRACLGDEDYNSYAAAHDNSHVLDLHGSDNYKAVSAEPNSQSSRELFKVHPFIDHSQTHTEKEEFGTFSLRRTKLSVYRPYRSDGDVLTSIRLRHKKNGGKEGLADFFQNEAPVIYMEKEKTWKLEGPTATIMQDTSSGQVSEEIVFRFLGRIVFTYWVGVQLAGGGLAGIYFAATRSAQVPVKDSGVNVSFFTIFMTISHFANAGYAPIDAGMTPFTKDLVLQIIFAGQMLLGNTMFPVALRTVVWMVRKWSKKLKIRAIHEVMLRDPGRFCDSLYPKKQTMWLAMVAIGCVTLLVSLVLGLMWNNKIVNGFSPGEKFVNAIYQSISARHTGVNVWNLGDWSPTVLYAFILIMYVPGQPVYSVQDHNNTEVEDDQLSFQSKKFVFQYSVFVAAVILLICIIENDNIVHDPLNFSILSIVLEVVSGFMNVGLSVGYSCSLRKREGACVDVPYSFSGKWSPASKLLLIIAMVVGRLR